MQPCSQLEGLCLRPARGQGEALTVDRHNLYQALYMALGHSCLSGLEPGPSATGASDAQVRTTIDVEEQLISPLKGMPVGQAWLVYSCLCLRGRGPVRKAGCRTPGETL